MSRDLTHSFRTVMQELLASIRSGWVWPSPEVGFARHVFDAAGEAVPVSGDDGGSWLANDRLDLAPMLASAGYLLGLRDRVHRPEWVKAWASGLERLSGKEAFTQDRLSFAYRPLEVFGIALGAAHCSVIGPDGVGWVRGVLQRLQQDGSSGSWADLLHGLAAHALALPWHDRLFLRLDGADIEALALLRWLVSTRPDATFGGLRDLAQLDAELIRRCAAGLSLPRDVARASVLYLSLGEALRSIVNSKSPRYEGEGSPAGLGKPAVAGAVPVDIDLAGLQGVPSGTVVHINFIDGGQHVGDKISIGGDNVGGAVGRGAAVVARDVTAFKNIVDQSSNIDMELRQKLKEARDAVEGSELSDEDKADAAESLKKLASELDKPERNPGMIKRFWGRVKDVAPTAAAILSSAASIAKIVAGG